MRKDLSKDITEFINLHAPELGIDGNSSSTSTSTSNNHSSANSVQVSRSNSDSNLLEDQRHSESSSSTSFLEASAISTTTDDMPESYLVSSRDESFLEYSSTDELNESRYHVESIILNEQEDADDDQQSSPLSQI